MDELFPLARMVVWVCWEPANSWFDVTLAAWSDKAIVLNLPEFFYCNVCCII